LSEFVNSLLRLRDAINNDIEIATEADTVLIYDRPIGPEGLQWRQLQDWWAEREGGIPQEEAKKTLYNRLQSCLPLSSPPQRFLFSAFHKAFGKSIPTLPALLPEVWLHWDPKTIAQRGSNALPRFRMDFLMLLPFGVRIVVEVDGKHHYADESGAASPKEYAKMVAADRDLRLARYEVFRFGAAELDGGDDGRSAVREFFELLFKRYGVSYALGSK